MYLPSPQLSLYICSCTFDRDVQVEKRKGYSHLTGTQGLINAWGMAYAHIFQPPHVNTKCHQVTLYPLLHLSFPKKGQPVPPSISCNLDPGMEGHSSQTLDTQLLHMYHRGDPREALVIVVHGSIVT